MAALDESGPAQKLRTGAPVRAVLWALHLGLPLLGLWLLIAQPQLDIRWEDHPTHAVLVGAVALLNLPLALLIDRAALRRRDARLFLVALAFLAAAGFLGLHALATPGVLVDTNIGFVLATPVGLLLAAILALASSVDLTPERAGGLLHWRLPILAGLGVAVAAWWLASRPELSPLGERLTEHQAHTYEVALAIPTIVLFGVAAWRYWRLYRRRPSVMLLSLITAFALLGEASAVVAAGTNWHLSWWLWHLLMTGGFGFVTYSAYVQYQREGASAGLFDSLTADYTVRKVREEYRAALDTLVGVLRRHERQGMTDDDLTLVTAGLAQRFGLTEGQAAVLGRAAEALAADRDQLRRLDALVGVGQECKVIVSEQALLRDAMWHIARGYDRDAVRVGLISDEKLHFPPELATPGIVEPADLAAASEALTTHSVVSQDGLVVLPLTVKDRSAGVLEVRRMGGGTFDERDYAALRSLANQLSIGLENARLFQQIDVLFRQYMSPDVATALLADPGQAALGGAVVEVTALFADLRGFTTFSEFTSPEEIVSILNRYFAAACECVLSEGGTVVQFMGDALMAIFNAPARQSDHARRAAHAALAMQAAIEPIAADHPEWPRFRVGVNTGPALIGNIGSEAVRSFTAMGDAINVASRLETSARPGSVVISGTTRAALGSLADVASLGELALKGRSQPVPAFELRALRRPPATVEA